MARRLLVPVLLGVALLAACGETEPAADTRRPVSAPTAPPPTLELPPPTPEAPAPPSEPVDAVLYTIGLSTDPFGESHPAGIGLVTGLETGDMRRDEIRDDDLGWFWPPPRWIDPARVVASRKGPPFRPPLVFAVVGDVLRRLGPAPLRPLEPVGLWSPDGTLVATEPIARCEPEQGVDECYRQSGAVQVVDADGERRQVGRWHLGGWAPDGRLLVTDDRGEEYLALDVAASRAQPVIDRAEVAELAGRQRVGVDKPVWSADRRFVAALAGIPWGRRSGKVGTIVLARADGTPLRLVTSPYIVSMLACSPTGHRLAYTTSGFPDPHELFVLDEPDGEPRRLFAAGARHFDWFTWSPDGRFLLVDDEHAARRGRWLLIDAETGRIVRRLPRLGGAPQWCCSVNAYVTLNG
jgi:hypothetical protein